MDNGETHEQVIRQFGYWTVPHFEIPNLLEILKLYIIRNMCLMYLILKHTTLKICIYMKKKLMVERPLSILFIKFGWHTVL